MDAGIDPTTGDLSGERISSLANAIYLRLTTPLGSWWADPALGSRLHELGRSKDLPRVGRLARQYAEDALAPLIADGRASAINVNTDQLKDGWLRLQVEVTDRTGDVQVFRHLVRVS